MIKIDMASFMDVIIVILIFVVIGMAHTSQQGIEFNAQEKHREYGDEGSFQVSIKILRNSNVLVNGKEHPLGALEYSAREAAKLAKSNQEVEALLVLHNNTKIIDRGFK
ncbi:biopolymer transporter ExbD [Saccharophagus degradans]|uniref:Biopolymer transport protein ExbD/TolR n=1 Tax=Saccharophagus degradans TaxID=86304 RepID=A0AAW7XCE0_9GAMM|nr:biopolymer transporter ExbD [Saccharophagus degradans]MDO6424910.1 hypothetical protein [Saccharophagus degradans]MDO6609796.1 hypothetical protein [Saccharophagus degradans]